MSLRFLIPNRVSIPSWAIPSPSLISRPIRIPVSPSLASRSLVSPIFPGPKSSFAPWTAPRSSGTTAVGIGIATTWVDSAGRTEAAAARNVWHCCRRSTTPRAACRSGCHLAAAVAVVAGYRVAPASSAVEAGMIAVAAVGLSAGCRRWPASHFAAWFEATDCSGRCGPVARCHLGLPDSCPFDPAAAATGPGATAGPAAGSNGPTVDLPTAWHARREAPRSAGHVAYCRAGCCASRRNARRIDCLDPCFADGSLPCAAPSDFESPSSVRRPERGHAQSRSA